MMSKQAMVAKLRENSGWLPGKTIKFDFGAEGVILLDGVAGDVREEDGEADTVIAISWDDLQSLGKRELDPMSALMQGRLRISGDIANAMQLQGVIEKLGAG